LQYLVVCASGLIYAMQSVNLSGRVFQEKCFTLPNRVWQTTCGCDVLTWSGTPY